MKVLKTFITSCDDCRYKDVHKVYTPDSFENVRRIDCTLLKGTVYPYLDWNDKAGIPKSCPLEDA